MNAHISGPYDVLGIGAVSVDFQGRLDQWPRAGVKKRLEAFSVQDGGLVGTALVTVSRLGGKACFAGKLGHSDLSARALKALQDEGVDTSFVIRNEGAEPAVSIVLCCADGGQRNIFSFISGVNFPFPDELPDPNWYHRVKVLLIDHVSGLAGVEAAKLAREHGVQVVIDAERTGPHVAEALSVVDHVVVPRDFAADYTGTEDMAGMLESLRVNPMQTVIITCGDDGCWGLGSEGEFYAPAWSVQVVDTTGCGDVFHGAYALALAWGQAVEPAARFASAAAALAATKMGGRGGIPRLEEVQRLLGSMNRSSVTEESRP